MQTPILDTLKTFNILNNMFYDRISLQKGVTHKGLKEWRLNMMHLSTAIQIKKPMA